MSRLLTTLTLAAALAVASAQQPLCDYARAKCDSDCQAGGLVATAFLCRDTPFGTLQSCTCGPQVGGAELASSSESYSSDSSSSSSSSALPWVSSSSTDSSSGSSSSSEAAGEQTFLFFIPQSRRFGPFQQPLPLFQPPAQLADPFSAARVAHLSDLLDQQRRAVPLIVEFEFEHFGAPHGHHDEHHDEHHHGQPHFEDDGEEEEGPCLMGTLLLLLLAFSTAFCCTRAMRLMLSRRREQPVARQQLLVDCTAGELTSPLLLVEERAVGKV